MIRKDPTTSTASYWRARFVEIAREAAQAGLVGPAGRPGLRPRSRMAGFATLRLGRRGGAQARVG